MQALLPLAEGKANDLSANLATWSAIDPATQVAPNLSQLTDTAATNYPKRIHQLRSN